MVKQLCVMLDLLMGGLSVILCNLQATLCECTHVHVHVYMYMQSYIHVHVHAIVLFTILRVYMYTLCYSYF